MHRAKPKLLIFIVAYFAESTIEKVVRRIPASLTATYEVEVLIIDDSSKDRTFDEGQKLAEANDFPFSITVLYNPVNQGYGGNQKIGYHYAIEKGFDYVALLHGDGQYAPEVLGDLAEPLRLNEADAVFGSRMLTPKQALKGGMPLYKFVGNRVLTKIQNILLNTSLSEFHSGYRIYSVEALKALPFERNANVFHFDTEIIIQLVLAGKRIKELPIPTYYGDEICRVDGMKYAADVIKASVQARLQGVNLFYDRRFDCAVVEDGSKYPSKLSFDSTHSRVLGMIPSGARVLDLGSGFGAVGAALKAKGCTVFGCDMERGPGAADFDGFVHADLNQGIPDLSDGRFDYILLLDVIEHLSAPEEFLDQLRQLAAQSGAKVIITTANIGFIIMRLSLLIGRFEYGKRGILDLTHTRLFTFRTLRRTMRSAGFDVSHSEGIVVPTPFVFGNSVLSRAAMWINQMLVRVFPGLFAFQILVTASARPTLETLLGSARRSAQEKSDASLQISPSVESVAQVMVETR